MPTPRLLHRTPVYLRKIDREFTAVMDDNLHEPVGEVRREPKPIRLECQHQPNSKDDPRVASSGGIALESDGYCLFLTSELRAAKVTIEDGDRIVQIGDEPNDFTVNYYIVKVKPMGHYRQHGGATMLRAYYEDREPSRHRGDR